MVSIKSKREIDIMRLAGRIVAETLDLVGAAVVPGITTGELDKIAEDHIRKSGAIPSFKGLYDFPASICASINEQVVHGIPGSTVLKEGDIISVDVGAGFKGYHGDAARTFAVGDISDEAKRLIQITQESFFKGIEFAVKGNRVSDISHAIQEYVEQNGFSVVRDLVGHGIGKEVHEKPEVPNFGPPNKGARLLPGMTIAVEPMINQGKYAVKTLDDEWTVVTVDKSLSAHYENTILITNDKPIILTAL